MKIECLTYQGMKIETPFEWEMRQLALNRKIREEQRESDIKLEIELLKLKHETKDN